MARDRERTPLEQWRRKEKQKATEERRKTRATRLAEIPAHRRDPAPLVAEIYQLSVQEYEGRLNSDGKLRKKHLLDQYHSIKKARSVAGLETIELAEFDPESHERAKQKRLQEARRSRHPQSGPHQSSPHQNGSQPNDPKSIATRADDGLDDRGFPRLPDGPPPTNEELAALGLPAYALMMDDDTDADTDDTGDNNLYEMNVEAQLEEEYAAFRAAIASDE